MATKGYFGKIKYPDESSHALTQPFKLATVSTTVQNGRLYVETRLKCNPDRLHRSNELINGAEVSLKSTRLTIKQKTGRENSFNWEFHFIGETLNITQGLLKELQSWLKATSKSHHMENKAEVGNRKKPVSFINGLHDTDSKAKVNQDHSKTDHSQSKAEVGHRKKLDSTPSGRLSDRDPQTNQELIKSHRMQSKPEVGHRKKLDSTPRGRLSDIEPQTNQELNKSHHTLSQVEDKKKLYSAVVSEVSNSVPKVNKELSKTAKSYHTPSKAEMGRRRKLVFDGLDDPSTEADRDLSKSHERCSKGEVEGSKQRDVFSDWLDSDVAWKANQECARTYAGVNGLKRKKASVEKLSCLSLLDGDCVSSPQKTSKAEAGHRKTTYSASKAGLSDTVPKANQELARASPRTNGLQRKEGSAEEPLCVSPTDSDSESPHFTRMKENKHMNVAIIDDLEDDCKENQHRGPVNQNVEPPSQFNSKPLPTFRFYGQGALEKRIFTDLDSKNGICKVVKSRPVSGSFLPPQKAKGQFSDLMSTYSWSQNTLLTAVKKEAPPLQGFANLGNTCYMNAILQSLFGLDTFSIDLHSVCKRYGKVLTRQSLALALTRLMLTKQRPANNTADKVEDLLHGVKRAISATARRFIGSQQHDAHEFLLQVLDQLKEEVTQFSEPIKETATEETEVLPPQATDSVVPTNSPVDASGDVPSLAAQSYLALGCRTPPRSHSTSAAERIAAACHDRTPPPEQSDSPGGCLTVENGSTSSMSGLLVNPTFSNFEFEVVHAFRCMNCQEQVQKAEQFNDLSVDIPKCKLGTTLSLQDALDIFFKKEEINYRCQKCQHTMAEVTHKFAKLPRVLILHLKRYTYSQSNNKTQEKILLPRYLSLQDHCDTSTIPHLPHRIMPLNSPLKSPLLNSPIGQPLAATPDYRRRRRSQEENGPLRSHKKVRRSLLPEVQADAPATSKTSPNSMASKAVVPWNPKPEVITVDMEADDVDLQRAIKLSMQEYQDSLRGQITTTTTSPSASTTTNDSHNNGSVLTQQSASACEEEEGKMDLRSMSYEKQMQLAIQRSLAEKETDNFQHFQTPQHSNDLEHHPSAPAPIVFKKPPSSLKNDNKSKDILTLTNDYNLVADAPSSNDENDELDMSILGVRSFTSASDFMCDTDIRQGSPDGERCNNNAADSAHPVFTSCRSPNAMDKSVEAAETSTMSANIGSLGALSNMSAETLRDSSVDDKEGSIMNTWDDDEEGFHVEHYDPVSSPSCTVKRQDGDTSLQSVPEAPYLQDEDSFIAKSFMNDWADAAEMTGGLGKGMKGGTEEKENVSPEAKGDRSQSKADCREAKVDKETEEKQLQRRLRLAEIEKGVVAHSYRLVSVVNHHGDTSSFGHYVSDVLDIKKSTWFSFDDRNVEPTSESIVRNKRTNSGYIFFYLSKDIYDDIESTRPGGTGKELIAR